MKHARKLLMLVMAAFMALVVATPAFAADGSVTVTNANVGQDYKLYKLFDAEMGTNDAITYTLPEDKEVADLTYTNAAGEAKSWFELNTNGFVVAKANVSTDWAKDPDAIAWAKGFGIPVGDTITATENETVSWTGLDYGYYFVDSSLGSFIGVNSANKAAEITDKNSSEVIVDKEITGVTDGSVSTDKEKALAQIGSTVSYTVVISAKAGAENYILTDEMEHLALVADSFTINGVSFDDSTIIVKPNEGESSDGKSKLETSGYTLVFTKAYLDTIKADTNITIAYNAIVQADAVTTEAGNPNKATLSYGHKTGEDGKPGNTTTDEVKVYTAKVTVTKTDGTSGLAGAEFALKNADGKYYLLADGTDADTEPEVSWVDDVDDATKFTSGSDGKLNGEFKGLRDGSYTLEETVAPTGYNKLPANDTSLQFTVAGADYTNANLNHEATVVNNKGTVLPSTGGMGTTILYIVGGILLAGGAIVLISKRRVAEMEK